MEYNYNGRARKSGSHLASHPVYYALTLLAHTLTPAIYSPSLLYMVQTTTGYEEQGFPSAQLL